MTLSLITICHYAWSRYAECQILFVVMLSVLMLSFVMLCRYAECPYAECLYAECRGVISNLKMELTPISNLVSFHNRFKVSPLSETLNTLA